MAELVARLIAAFDFWLLFQWKISRRPARWVALHHLLLAPVLSRVRRAPADGMVGGRAVTVDCAVRPERWDDLLEIGIELRPPAAPGRGAGQADLSVGEVHPWAVGRRRAAGETIVPLYCRSQGPPASRRPARRETSRKSDVQRIRRSGLIAVQGRGRRRWEALRRELTEPYIARRHGPGAWTAPWIGWRLVRRHGELVFIEASGRRVVAGAAFGHSRDGRTVWLFALGAPGSVDQARRSGALAAVYQAATIIARARGASVIDAGRSTSRVGDPLSFYKRKWGLGLTPDPLSPLVALRAHTEAGAAALDGLAVYRLTEEGLRGPGGEPPPG